MLRVADFSAGACHREIEPLLRAGYGAEAAGIVALALSRHDYDAALAALVALRQPEAGNKT